MYVIRQATPADAGRIAEIEVFNYRLNFYPIFKSDKFYFDILQVSSKAEEYLADPHLLQNTWVYDDGVVKGFIRVEGTEVQKLFVEPALQGQAIGAVLLEYMMEHRGVNHLWALEKNKKAIRFYERHGFRLTENKKPEEETTEYLVQLVRERTVPIRD